ncbi:MAG TPA: hypothetical protein VF490_03085 [Chryseosolibacter sp.]
MKKTMVVILMSVFAWTLNTARAQKPGVVLSNDEGWQKIGETVASFKSQDESIAVLGADEFAAIKIKVEDAPLRIDRLQVFYESGDMQEIKVDKQIQAGEESGVFKLDHPTRDIQKVAFTYHTLPNANGDKAGVELYGMKTGDKSSDAYRKDDDRVKDRSDRTSEETREDINRKAERTENDVDRAAEKTGKDISETAGNVAADIDDPKLDTKVGPQGQTIYVGDDSRYYYVNQDGKRVYCSWSQLKDKKDKDE